MEPNHQDTLSHGHLLVNLAPSAMVMPGVTSSAVLEECESSRKLLQVLRAGKRPYLFAVMSDPRLKEFPVKFYKVGVIAEVEVDMEAPVIILNGMFRAEMGGLKRIGGGCGGNQPWG